MGLKAATIGEVFNQSQKSVALHKNLTKTLQGILAKQGSDSFVKELDNVITTVLLQKKGDAAAERVVKFVGQFAAAALSGICEQEEVGHVLESVLEWCIVLGASQQNDVRFRACQLIQTVCNNIPVELGIDESLAQELQTSLVPRVKDTCLPVRVQAIKALRMLACQDESGDFDSDPGVQALREVLLTDKNRGVRLAACECLPLSVKNTRLLLDRTCDIEPDVRAAAFHALQKAPVHALSIEQRATLLRRGLRERADIVQKSAQEMLAGWYISGCGSNITTFVELLDVETNEDAATLAIQALTRGGLFASSTFVEKAQEQGESLRAMQAPLTAATAFVWRAVCEHLHNEAISKGMAAAATTGAAATADAAAACEQHEALEDILPETADALVALIALHSKAGPVNRYATCQLLKIASTCWDWADAMGREVALSALQKLISLDPCVGQEQEPESCGVLLAGNGGSADWERCVLEVTHKVSSSTASFATFVLDAIHECASSWGISRLDPEQTCAPAMCSSDGTARWLQVLALASALLERLPSGGAGMGPDVEQRLHQLCDQLVMPVFSAKQQACVRMEALRCLSLLCMVLLSPEAAKPRCTALASRTISLLSTALLADTPAVQNIAAKGLCDLLLLLGASTVRQAYAAWAVQQAATAGNAGSNSTPGSMQQVPGSVVQLLLRPTEIVLQERAGSIARFGSSRCTDGPSEIEATASTAVEGLAKLILHQHLRDSSSGLQDSEVQEVLAHLLVLNFHPDVADITHIRQCLPVFLELYARSHPSHQRHLCAALWAASRRLLQLPDKGSTPAPQLVAYFVVLLSSAPNAGGEDLGHETLAEQLCCEMDNVISRSKSWRSKVNKDYFSAICTLLPVLHIQPSEQQRIQTLQALVHHLQQKVQDKQAAKMVASFAAKLDGLQDAQVHPLDPSELAQLLDKWEASGQGSSKLSGMAEHGSQTPAGRRSAKSTAPRTRRRAVASRTPAMHKAASSSDSDSEGSDAPAPPAASQSATRVNPGRRAAAATNVRLGKIFEASASESGSDSNEDDGGYEHPEQRQVLAELQNNLGGLKISKSKVRQAGGA